MSSNEGARYTLAEIFKVFLDGMLCGFILAVVIIRLMGH